MRIQCDVCERAVASVMCCADEAALCTDCDGRVHAANKLANKHQRVPLIGARQSPRCDICQEKSAFFFCLEDRALLCRDCDLSIHSATALSSAHQRFLVPGTRVALEALSGDQESVETSSVEDFGRHPLSCIMNGSSMVNGSSNIISPQTTVTSSSISSKSSFAAPYRPPTALCPSEVTNHPAKSSAIPSRLLGVNSSLPSQVTHSSQSAYGISSNLARRTSITEFLSDAIPNWRVDELLNIPELAEGYSLGDISSSKADVSNLGDYDWTADLSLFDEQVLYAESFHEVPKMPSPPTASGVVGRGGRGTRILKGKAKQESVVPDYDDTFVVPDLGLHSGPASPALAKRRRPFIEV